VKTVSTANQLRGRAIGSIFFAAFGAVWILLALYARQTLTAITFSATLLGAFVLVLGALQLLRQAKRWPLVADDPVMARRFTGINVLQSVAISIVVVSFARFHIDAYVMNAITAIVGLHLFPLARLFRYPLHYASGALLVTWALLSALFVPADQLQSVTASGTGLILWLSSTVTLLLAMQAARQPANVLERT